MKLFLAFTFLVLDAVDVVQGHGTMISPTPRQPESLYWYQVGCMIGCTCSGGGKETYPSLESVNCKNPIEPTNTEVSGLTWNAHFQSPRQDWNKYMPWRAPGSAIPLDACGIASGFLPTAAVQFPHQFSTTISQGAKGSELPTGHITTWTVNSVVEASFSLTVNHGGGYQYRVCPKSNNNDLSNDCFEQNPLSFATDTHIVTLKDAGGKQFEIPATDVSVGVRPTGSSWRRLPLPACNCDLGSNCSPASTPDQYKSYNTTTLAAKPYGHCTTGLQFEAPHLKSIWPYGYGYYVATLGGEHISNARCGGYSDSDSCHKVNGCSWYVERNTCYETKKIDDSKKPNDKDGLGIGVSPCAKQMDKVSCVATLANTQAGTNQYCTWFDNDVKKVCYDAEKYKARRQLKEQTSNMKNNNYDMNWSITDKLRAPSVPGDYVLQWRWDNEQTPQIWTTCADIKVTDGSTSSSASLTPLLSNWLPFLSFAMMVTTVATGTFW